MHSGGDGVLTFIKSGVILSGISPNSPVQQILFDRIGNRPERLELSRNIDKLNQRHGLKTVGLAVEGTGSDPWKVKCEHRSGNYLTDIDDILTVRI